MLQFVVDLVTLIARTLIDAVTDVLLPSTDAAPAPAGASPALPDSTELRAQFERLRRGDPPADWLARVNAASGTVVRADPAVPSVPVAATPPNAAPESVPPNAEPASADGIDVAQPASAAGAPIVPAPATATPAAPVAPDVAAASTPPAPPSPPAPVPVQSDRREQSATPGQATTDTPAPPVTSAELPAGEKAPAGAEPPAGEKPSEPAFLQAERLFNPNFGGELQPAHEVDLSALPRAPVHGSVVDKAAFAALHLGDGQHRPALPASIAALPLSPSRDGWDGSPASAHAAHPGAAGVAAIATPPASGAEHEAPNAWPPLPAWPPADRARGDRMPGSLRARVGTSWYV